MEQSSELRNKPMQKKKKRNPCIYVQLIYKFTIRKGQSLISK